MTLRHCSCDSAVFQQLSQALAVLLSSFSVTLLGNIAVTAKARETCWGREAFVKASDSGRAVPGDLLVISGEHGYQPVAGPQ